jgi:hypothetical protein
LPSAVILVLAIAPAACNGSSNPTPPAAAGGETLPLFIDVTAPSRLDFRHDAGVDGSFFMPQIMGAGTAIFDYEGDGDLDIYLLNGAYRKQPAPARPVNRLLRREPDGTYRDVTEASGLGDDGFGMGVAVGDFDNDGHPDVYVANHGPDALYRNNGDGTFTNVTRRAGVRNARWACSVAFFDYDLDGYLDLFVGNYVHYPELKGCADDAGRPEYCGPASSPPTPDVLLHNNGDGTFSDETASSGIGSRTGRGLGVVCEDFDGDGWIDVYVANDGETNFLWINNADGTFTESAVVMGAALSASGTAEASMGVTAGDIDGDGDLDLFMAHLARETNTLYRNDGQGNFDDVTVLSGLAGPSLPLTGFGAAFLDIDHDGALDIAVANGRVARGPVIEGTDPSSPLAAYAEPNLLFRNDGDGRFTDISELAGPFCDPVEISRGLAVGDLDGDGDLDMVVSNCDGPARILSNEAPKRGHWLIIRAVDPQLGRDAYGARVIVTAGERRFHRTINPGYSYASSNDPRAHFGLGTAERVDSIEVRWPDGRIDQFGPTAADQVVTLTKSVAAGG